MSPEPPLDATGIARRQFSTARKGYDPTEVRAFLHEVSAVVGRLQRGEAHEHDRAERAESRAHLAEQLDEHRLVELLGEETARVLEAAREAAGDIRTKAEESAARMVLEAQVEARAIAERADREATAKRIEILADADSLRREAEDEVERRRVEGQVVLDDMRREAEVMRERMLAEGERARAEAEAAAELIRASAREQGRRLVGEAQAVRERMLGDLSRRRRAAREQLERLNGARERLLAAYAVVKRTVEEATTELTVALPEARIASEMAMRRVSDEPEETVEVLEAELSVARMAGQIDDGAAASVTDDELDAMLRELAEEEAAQAAAAAAGDDHTGDGDGDDPGDGDGEGADAADGDGVQAADGADGVDQADGVVAAGGGATGGGDPGPGTATDAGALVADAEATEDDRAGAPAGGETAAGGPEAPGAGEPSVDAREGEGAPSAVGTASMSDGDKWGIRLPKPKRTAASAAGAGDRSVAVGPGAATTPAPVPVTATARVDDSPGDAVDGDGTQDGDEGESGPYVDELFARIRAERTPGEGGADEADATSATASTTAAASAAGDEAGAVALAVRPEVDGEVRPDGTPTGGAAAPAPSLAPPGTETLDDAVRRPAAETATADAEAGATEVGAEDSAGDAEPGDPASRLLHRRDDLLAGVERELGRRLKRVLADEQNEVLDRLRRGGTIDFADVVPAADEHVDRFAIAATPDLDAAAAHGAALAGVEPAASCDELAAALGRTLVTPLRARIERSFDDGDGDLEEVTERLRALYREWKGNHIGIAVRHFTVMAYAQGAYDAAADGAALRWLVDRSCEACPDCDDNALAGKVAKGEAFPTGDAFAPAHPDCRCLVVAGAILDVA
jgi:DivIVA domain-containing protein